MDPLLVAPEEVGEMIRAGRGQVYKMIKSGELPSIKIGRLRRIPVAEVKKWIDRQVALAKELGTGDDGHEEKGGD